VLFNILLFKALGPGAFEDLIIRRTTSVVVVQTLGGLGTGFFIGPNEILTNAHVVDGDVVKLRIRTARSEQTYVAEIIARSKEADLALLRLKDWPRFTREQTWSIARFARMLPEAGEQVWSLGHPWGLLFTVSRGVVSAKERRIDDSPQFFVQTDAKVYSGNSGGPLFDMMGRVIGVNARMLVQPGGSFGMAIEARFVQRVIRELRTRKTVFWEKLGCSFKPNEEDVFVVAAVSANQPCAIMDLRPGDIVRRGFSTGTGRSGMPIVSMDALRVFLSLIDEGTRYTLFIDRDGKMLQVSTTAIDENKAPNQVRAR